jgi:hypothetical protein
MSEGRRPGGLTALAIFNFVFGGLSLLGSLALFGAVPLLEQASQTAMNEQQRAQVDALLEMGRTSFLLLLAGGVIGGVLLIVSGVGYLKLKRFLGRTLGNVYAVCSLVLAVLMALYMPVALGGGFNISTLLNFLYPVLTLFLLNTTFKEDFVN